jgi:hypothetical protein
VAICSRAILNCITGSLPEPPTKIRNEFGDMDKAL